MSPESLKEWKEPIRASLELHKYLKSREKSLKLISFDVFDTLITRSIHPPDQVKAYSAKKFQSLLANFGKYEKAIDLWKRRDVCETKLREENLASGGDGECRIDELMLSWLCSYLPLKEAQFYLTSALEWEKQAELGCQSFVDGMIPIIEWARTRGVLIVCVSDTHFSSSDLARFFSSRYELTDNFIFTSANYGVNKSSGRLFEVVLSRFNLRPQFVCHVGDHFQADVEGPNKVGVEGIWFQEKKTFENKLHFEKLSKVKADSDTFTAARWQLSASLIDKPYRVSSLAQDIGFTLLGPLLCSFVHQLLIEAKSDSVETLLFPSRDGFLLREIVERILPAVPELGPVSRKYLYLSRRAVFPCCAKALDSTFIWTAFSSLKPTWRNFSKRLGLNPEDIERFIEPEGVLLDDWVKEPYRNEIVKNVFENGEFRSLLLRKQREHEALLRRYLEQNGVFHKRRVGLVDLGWSGSLQYSLSTCFEEESAFPAIHGYYFGLRRLLPIQDTPRSKYRGLIYDAKEHNSRYSSVAKFVELFEIAARAPHQTVIGYEDDGIKVHPLLRSEDHPASLEEKKTHQLSLELQAGILSFAESYRDLLPYILESPALLRQYPMFLFDRLIRFPRKKEAELLCQTEPVDDFDDESKEDRVSGLSWWQVPKFVQATEGSMWPEGLIRQNSPFLLVLTKNLYTILRHGHF